MRSKHFWGLTAPLSIQPAVLHYESEGWGRGAGGSARASSTPGAGGSECCLGEACTAEGLCDQQELGCLLNQRHH